MSSINNNSMQKSDAFGFFSNHQLQEKIQRSIDLENTLIMDPRRKQKPCKEDEVHAYTVFLNLEHAIGYLPIIGTIAAIVKLIFINKLNFSAFTNETAQTEILAWVSGETIRSWIEVTSLGIFLIIPDIIFTIIRYCQNTSDNTKIVNDCLK